MTTKAATVNGHGHFGKYSFIEENHKLRNLLLGTTGAGLLAFGGYKVSGVNLLDIYDELFPVKTQTQVAENGERLPQFSFKLEDFADALNETSIAEYGKILPSQVYGLKSLPTKNLNKIAAHFDVPPSELMKRYGFENIYLGTFSRTNNRLPPDGIYGEGYYVFVQKDGKLEVLGSLSSLQHQR